MFKSFLSLWIVLLFTCTIAIAQEVEVAPPYNIKTVTFIQNGQNMIPIFELGDAFELQFDDLFGNEANYYFSITHCDYDWKQSQLFQTEYLIGQDNLRIQDYSNSFNTLQSYSHYRLPFPNKYMQFKVSGNYIIKILNEDRDVVFSRKIILYEDLVSVPMQVKRSRNLEDISYKHNMDFSIQSANISFQSPLKNVKVLLMQNGKFNNAISDIKPMYTIGNDLIYKYNKETQFWAGNEFLYFDNKNIRGTSNAIAKVSSDGNVYSFYLYPNNARASSPYTYWPDVDGNFVVNNMSADNNEIQADYAWIYFSLSAPAYYGKKDIYVTGMFNNYAMTAENKMEYNKDKAVYEKAIMIKQGFTNFQYTIADNKGVIDEENAIDGNFYQTENNYFCIVYYRENGQRYDRVIGKGIASSVDITN